MTIARPPQRAFARYTKPAPTPLWRRVLMIAVVIPLSVVPLSRYLTGFNGWNGNDHNA